MGFGVLDVVWVWKFCVFAGCTLLRKPLLQQLHADLAIPGQRVTVGGPT